MNQALMYEEEMSADEVKRTRALSIAKKEHLVPSEEMNKTVERLANALANANTIPMLKEVCSAADAVARYMRHRKAGKVAESEARRIMLRAQLALGELLKDVPLPSRSAVYRENEIKPREAHLAMKLATKKAAAEDAIDRVKDPSMNAVLRMMGEYVGGASESASSLSDKLSRTTKQYFKLCRFAVACLDELRNRRKVPYDPVLDALVKRCRQFAPVSDGVALAAWERRDAE